MNQTTISAPAGSIERLPLGGLLALAMAAFITLLTEIMPAGVLSSIAGDLNVSESLAGQFITAYAVGALVAAIPLTALTQGMRRRPLLLSAICGFAIVNLVTALSHDYHVSLATRFFAGVFGGIVWSLLAGYAVRMSPAHLGGRAIAISGAGATLALVLGVPLGTLLGRAIGWQGAFGLMTLMALALALALVAWIIAIVPDFPGQAKAHRPSLSGVFLQCGIRAVLFVVFTFIVAHNILYIYLEPFLKPSGLSERVDIVLFIFGLGAIAGLGIAGMLVDRRVQSLTVTSIVIFSLAAVLLGSGGRAAPIVYLSVALWGVAFGGFATLTQTALSRLSGRAADVAQSMYTTGWNTAVAAGGAVGGMVLDKGGAASFAWAIIGFLVLSLTGTLFAMNRALASQR
ncbi:MFS transporter [Serratia marcescens]